MDQYLIAVVLVLIVSLKYPLIFVHKEGVYYE